MINARVYFTFVKYSATLCGIGSSFPGFRMSATIALSALPLPTFYPLPPVLRLPFTHRTSRNPCRFIGMPHSFHHTQGMGSPTSQLATCNVQPGNMPAEEQAYLPLTRSPLWYLVLLHLVTLLESTLAICCIYRTSTPLESALTIPRVACRKHKTLSPAESALTQLRVITPLECTLPRKPGEGGLVIVNQRAVPN